MLERRLGGGDFDEGLGFWRGFLQILRGFSQFWGVDGGEGTMGRRRAAERREDLWGLVERFVGERKVGRVSKSINFDGLFCKNEVLCFSWIGFERSLVSEEDSTESEEDDSS